MCGLVPKVRNPWSLLLGSNVGSEVLVTPLNPIRPISVMEIVGAFDVCVRL